MTQYSVEGCVSCPSYSYGTPLLGFQGCQPCPTGCKVCASAAGCTECDRQYTLANQSCLCSNENTNCSLPRVACPPSGYPSYLAGSCLPCPYLPGCAQCLDATSCGNCSLGYFLPEGGSCQACASFCSSCPENVCEDCFEGYELGEDGCEPSSSASPVCPPSMFSVNGSCAGCSLGLSCQFCRDNNTCTACNPGYFMASVTVEFEMVLCLACPPSCLACVSALDCTACLDGSQDCLRNPCAGLVGQGCANCVLSSSGGSPACVACTFEQHLTPTYQCANCPANCNYCTTMGACDGCMDGFYGFSGVCVPCSAECISCESNAHCDDCKPTYYPSGAGCLACPPSCYYCNESTSCMACLAGYELHNAGDCRLQGSNVGVIIGLSVALAIMTIVMSVMIYFCVNKPAPKRTGQYIEIN